MPPVVATKFPTPVSIIAAPVAKGILIKTTIEAGYHEDGTITLRQHPALIHKLRHKETACRMELSSTTTLFVSADYGDGATFRPP